MRVNSSQSGHLRASNGTGSSGYPPRYPSDSTSRATSGGGGGGGAYAQLRQTASQSTTNGINTSSSLTSHDGKRLSRGSGPTAPELDFNDSTSMNLRTSNNNNGVRQVLRDATVQTSSTSPRPVSGRHVAPINNVSRDGTLPNGVLLGSMAGYLPPSAVALANESAAADTPHAQSPRVNSTARGNHNSAGSGAPDSRSSRQSITVLSVTRDGRAQDDTRPPSSASMNMNGSLSDMRASSTRQTRMASFNRVSSAGPNAASPRVLREAVVSIPLSDASTSTNISAMNRGTMPPPSAYRQQSPLPYHQQSSRASTAVPDQRSRPSPVHQSAATASTAAQHQQQQQQQQHHPQQQQQQRHQYPSPQRDQRNGELVVATQQPRREAPPNTVPSPAPYDHHHHHYHSGRGAVLHHRPSPAAVARHLNDSDANAVAPAAAASTLQVSTTTLTKACKKVRYLLPNEPFDPDAEDPTDMGGLTAAEEEALLDPVNYTRAADGVAGRYPMLLRRPSAHGGDLLRTRRGSAGQLDGAPRPTFLFDDGNRWARETNRPALATTRDPAGAALTQLPSPSILQKKQSNHSQDPAPFLAHHKVDEATETEGFLLQRHVQQLATGRQLVEGTTYEPPSMSQRQRERRAREDEEQHRLLTAAATAPSPSATQKQRGTAEAGVVKPRRGPTDGLYEEIIRRTNQNRRAALPTKMLAPPAGAGMLMPPLAPPSPSTIGATSSSSVAPGRPPVAPLPPPVRGTASTSGGRRRGRPHPNSAEPTPLHRGSGIHPTPRDDEEPQHYQHQGQQQQQPQQLRPPLPQRSSSQPYITSQYVEGTPNGSDASGIHRDEDLHYYYTPNTDEGFYAPPMHHQHQQQQQQQPSSRRPPPAPPAASHRHPPQAPPQQRVPSGQTAQQRHKSPSPRAQPPPPSSEATPEQSVTSTTPSVAGYTSGRFSKYNPPASALPPPPPPPAPSNPSRTAERVAQPRERPPVFHPAADVRHPMPPPQSQPQQNTLRQQSAQQQQQQQPQPPQADVPRHRRVTAAPPPTDRTQAAIPRRQVERPQHRPPPPQQQQQQQQQQQPQQQQSSSTRHAPPPPPLATTITTPAPQPAVTAPIASPYDEEDDEENCTYNDDEVVNVHGGDGLDYSDDEDPVTDAASSRTPRHHLAATMAPTHGAAAAPNDHAPQSSNINKNNSTSQNISSGSAGAEVRRSLLDQYNAGEDDRSEDTPRGTPRGQQQYQQQQQQQPLQRMVPQRRQNTSPDSTIRVSYDRAHAPMPPPPAAATVSSSLSASHDRSPHAAATYEEAPSMASSCNTETQPITVSERDFDEVDEEDDLVKKGPLVLKLGDEVYAEEGYLDDEDEEYDDEEEEDDGEHDDAGRSKQDDEEEEYWESQPETRNDPGRRDGNTSSAGAAAQQRGTVRYGVDDEHYDDEL